MDRGSARRRLLPAAVCGLILAAVTAFAQSEPPGPASELVAEVSRPGGEYLLGLGLAFRPHRVLAYGSVLGFDPLGINLGIGYGNDSLQAIGLYRQHSPGRLPYLEASDRRGGLLLLEYTPPRPDLRLTLENELYVGLVELRHSGQQLALYDQATATLDLLADHRHRISVVAELSALRFLRLPGGVHGIGLAVPMQFLDRTFIVEPRFLHSGLTRETGALARDLIGYRFGDFSVRRLFGLLGGVRSDTRGTTALVLNLEYRLHFLFTVGGALGIDWQSISLAIEAGYNHADRGFVWGLGFKSFRQEATAESAGDRSLPALRRPTGS